MQITSLVPSRWAPCAELGQHLLLDGARRQEAVHKDAPLLAVAPHARGSLLVVGWFPVTRGRRASRPCLCLKLDAGPPACVPMSCACLAWGATDMNMRGATSAQRFGWCRAPEPDAM